MEVITISVAICDIALLGTACVLDIIDSSGGVITGAHQLSSRAVSLIVEIDGR